MISLISLFSILFTSSPSSHAVKTGSACKKLNSKAWDGETPVICKKDKKGKLIWTKFNLATPDATTSNSNELIFSVVIVEKEAVGKISLYSDQGDGSEKHGLSVCSQSSVRWIGGIKIINYLKVTSATEIKLKDAAGIVVGLSRLSNVAWQKTGMYVSEDGKSTYPQGTCIFSTTFKVKKSDFYSLEIPNFSKPIDFSKNELESQQYKLFLTI